MDGFVMSMNFKRILLIFPSISADNSASYLILGSF